MKASPKTSPPSRLRRRGGAFTLIELLVVMAIIVILITATLPAMNTLMKGNGKAQAANMITAYLASALATAMNLRTPVALIFFEDPNQPDQTAVVLARYVHDSTRTPPDYMDGIPDRPVEYLPRGIEVATLDDSVAGGQLSRDVSANAPLRSRLILYDELGHVRLTDTLGANKISAVQWISAIYNVDQVVQSTVDWNTYCCIKVDTPPLAQPQPSIDAYPTVPNGHWVKAPWNLNNITANVKGVPGTPIGFASPAVLIYSGTVFHQENVDTFTDAARSDWFQKNGVLLVLNSYTGNLVHDVH